MSSTANKKHVVVFEVVPIMSKITNDKLNGLNYLDWSKMIRIYLKSIRMANRLVKDPPNDYLIEQWMEEDACLFLQICNSIDSEVFGIINHCEFVKELMDYLDFMFPGKGTISHIFDVCKAFYR